MFEVESYSLAPWEGQGSLGILVVERLSLCDFFLVVDEVWVDHYDCRQLRSSLCVAPFRGVWVVLGLVGSGKLLSVHSW